MFEMQVLATIFVIGAVYFATFYVAEFMFMQEDHTQQHKKGSH